MMKKHDKNLERVADILLVEDNDGDVLLTKKAFKNALMLNEIRVAKDGEEAMSMLSPEEPYHLTPLPDIVLLDINLPKKDGIQVLEEMKQDAILRRIPVVILTSSKAEKDILKSYGLYANSYILKPPSLNQFNDVVKAIENFWFNVVILPNDYPH